MITKSAVVKIQNPPSQTLAYSLITWSDMVKNRIFFFEGSGGLGGLGGLGGIRQNSGAERVKST